MFEKPSSQRLLNELDPEQQNELGNIDDLIGQLSGWQAPDPTPEEQTAMMRRLETQLSRPKSVQMKWSGWISLCLEQMRLFAPEFWYACAAMFLFTLVGGLLAGKCAVSLFTIVVSPLVAMAGVLYAFRSDSNSLSRLELASPVGAMPLFFCRSALVLTVNFLAMPLLLVPGQFLFPELVFWRVVLIWLGAVLGIYGLAVYTSIRWNGLARIVLPLGIWGLLVAAAGQRALAVAGKDGLLLDWLAGWVSTSNGVLLGSVLSMAAGGFLFYLSARLIQKDLCRWA